MQFLPMPRKLTLNEGTFRLSHRTRIVLCDTKPSALLYAEMLRDTIREETGLCLSILRGTPREGEIALREVCGREESSYGLNVRPEGVSLCAGSDAALCHGVQTLRQWVQRNGMALPALEIEDQPDLQNRGYYLDVSRGRVPTLATLKQYADLLCRYKINEWQLYVEHTYLFRDFSEVWRDETPLTAEEIMELDAYCRARCIELVPSLSTFGHMYKILSAKTNSDLCELRGSEKIPFSFTYAGEHHTLNVSNANAVDFIKSMIAEYMELFTSRKFNLCCDETYDLGKDKSLALAQEQGERGLYMSHLKTLCEFVLEKGRTPQFWGDILWRFPQAYSMLPKGVICLNWGYLPKQREDEMRMLHEAGATQYACPGVCTWNRWFPLVEDSFSNNRVMCGHGRKFGAIGHLNTDWGDYAHICHPWFSVPGILYGAAFAWNADSIDFDEINRAISFLHYGDRSETFMEAFTALSQNEVFEWFHAVRWIEEKDEAKRGEHFSHVDVTRAAQANLALRNAMERVGEAARAMPPRGREIVQALSIVSEGVTIWNNIALYLGKNAYGQPCEAGRGETLAAELETWYFAYLNLWRTVSREGGLHKTMAVITAWADYLRGREYNR